MVRRNVTKFPLTKRAWFSVSLVISRVHRTVHPGSVGTAEQNFRKITYSLSDRRREGASERKTLFFATTFNDRPVAATVTAFWQFQVSPEWAGMANRHQTPGAHLQFCEGSVAARARTHARAISCNPAKFRWRQLQTPAYNF